LESIRQHMVFARYNAPLAMVVCGNMTLALKGPDKDMWIMDCSAAIENMMILAPQIGLGSVWIGIYPVKPRVDEIRDLFNIPSHVIPMSIVYFGYPDEEKEPRTRYNEKAVHYQEYEQRKMRVKDKPKKGHY
ncbi:MAG: nitroreductase family protein, partial [Clostridia bacterium]|nr:nitroreductase family protein [Clostridia bacterium]